MKLDTLTSKSPIIYILIGLPASGKSTWTKNKIANSERSFSVISSDDVIESIANTSGKTYNEVFQDNVGTAIKQTWIDFSSAIKINKSIIWDQTNINSKKRANIINKVPNGYTKIAVVFKINDTDLIKRLKDRSECEGKTIPPHVIKSMSKNFQNPTKSEGFDEILYV